MDLIGSLRGSSENLMGDLGDFGGSALGSMGSLGDGVLAGVGSLGDAVGSVGSGLEIPNPLDILENKTPTEESAEEEKPADDIKPAEEAAEEEKPADEINSMPTEQAADIIWERMRVYMKEKGGKRATDLFKVLLP